MKGVLLALSALVVYDVSMRHGAGLHDFGAAAAGFGHAIGAWVFSTG